MGDFKDNSDYKYETIKLLNGSTALICFQKTEYRNSIEYNVVFGVSNKRKYLYQWINGEIELSDWHQKTGFSLEGLLWAKRKIIEFSEQVKLTNPSLPSYIIVRWWDNRRRNVYERGLEKLGFKMIFDKDGKRLMKKI